MRKLLLIFTLVWCSHGYGQIHHAFATMDTNFINAGFCSSGNLFAQDTADRINAYGFISYPNFILQLTPPFVLNPLGASNIWVGGMSSGALYTSSEASYSQYQSGPSHLQAQDSLLWDKIWLITRTDVLAVKNDFDVHHAITLPVPADVLDWPAKGNSSATGYGGLALTITQDMAPFFDRNGDGIYNVYDGDYPMMKGDKMLWWINNDAGSHNTNPMDIDRRYSAYEYNSLTDSNLSNTFFLSVMIRNQSARIYDSVTIGAYVNFDVGCANNDRIGSIPSSNSFYLYTGYNPGGGPLGGSITCYGAGCPTQSASFPCIDPILTTTFLNDSMKCFEYFTNGAGTSQTDPSTDLEFYRYMNGQWADATPVTFGAAGYRGTIPYPFAFPGNPADTGQWSECNTQIGPAMATGDRRGIGAIGPFYLGIGDTISFDMAFIYHPGPYDNCPDLSDSSSVVQHIDSVREYYRSERFPQWYDSTKSLLPAFYTVGINQIANPIFNLTPNPNNGSFNIHISNLSQADYAVSVTDMLGQQVYSSALYGTDQSVHLDNANSGVYSVTIESRNYRETRKVVITK